MKILIAGYGKMGHMVEEMARQKGWEILAALSSSDAGELQTLEKADVAVDFSHPAMLEPLAAYIRRTVQQTGARWRDFAVISRDGDRYTAALQMAMARYDVPIFQSAKAICRAAV